MYCAAAALFLRCFTIILQRAATSGWKKWHIYIEMAPDMKVQGVEWCQSVGVFQKTSREPLKVRPRPARTAAAFPNGGDFPPVSSHFCWCLISEAGFKGTRSHLCSLHREVRRSNRSDLREQAEEAKKKKSDSIMNVGRATQRWRVKKIFFSSEQEFKGQRGSFEPATTVDTVLEYCCTGLRVVGIPGFISMPVLHVFKNPP